MNEDVQAQRLAAWLAGKPGTPPPDGLDPDVIAAVYSLRPDLAPSSKLTADEILGDVRSGPLAGAHPHGRVLAFPAPRPANDTSQSAWRRWGTGGGVGALAAAAVLLIVLGRTEPAPPPVVAPDFVAEALPAPVAPATDAAAPAEVQRAEPSSPAAPASAAFAPDAPSKPKAEARAKEAPAEEIAEAELPAARDAWSAPDAAGAGGVVGGALAPPPAPVTPVMADAEREEAKSAPARSRSKVPAAAPAMNTAADLDDGDYATSNHTQAPDWRAVTDSSTLSRIDRGLADAAALASRGDRVGAARTLQPFIQPPNRAGLAVAMFATAYALEGGDVRLAVNIAERGLALTSEASPERARLLELRAQARARLAEPPR